MGLAHSLRGQRAAGRAGPVGATEHPRDPRLQEGAGTQGAGAAADADGAARPSGADASGHGGGVRNLRAVLPDDGVQPRPWNRGAGLQPRTVPADADGRHVVLRTGHPAVGTLWRPLGHAPHDDRGQRADRRIRRAVRTAVPAAQPVAGYRLPVPGPVPDGPDLRAVRHLPGRDLPGGGALYRGVAVLQPGRHPRRGPGTVPGHVVGRTLRPGRGGLLPVPDCGGHPVRAGGTAPARTAAQPKKRLSVRPSQPPPWCSRANWFRCALTCSA
ncbi:hypothetical protein G6F24_014285 [Rhizopus arrhizus]|nr:hypothetical protein G6F24_014285 [Rhizopus arrhizus]